MHPVHDYNLCEYLASDSFKLQKVKYEIAKVVKAFKEYDPIDAMKEIL